MCLGSMLSLQLRSMASLNQRLKIYWGSLSMSVIETSNNSARLTALRVLSDNLRSKGSDSDDAQPRERRPRHDGVLCECRKRERWVCK